MKTKKDFGIYPLGSAKLALENGKLNVDCLDNSGVDGVLIKTYGSEDYTINFGNLSQIVKDNGIIRTATICRNANGMAYTAFESYKWCNPEKDKVILGCTKKHFPTNTKVKGKLNGKEVFNFDLSEIKPCTTMVCEPVTIIIGIIAIGTAIWAALRTEKRRHVTAKYDKDGNFIGYDVTYTEDPIEFEAEINGKVYTVNEICFSYDSDGEEKDIPISVAEEITAYNIKNFVIESIEINK